MNGPALERLIRGAMASGAMCLVERANAGQIDLTASLSDVLGDYPTQWIAIRADLVEDMIAEVKTDG